jgi:hypothetical protein
VLHDNLLFSLVSVIIEPFGQHHRRSHSLVTLRKVFHLRLEILWWLQLINNEPNFSIFSECALNSKEKWSDFDSAIRRFESSRPSQPVRSLGFYPESRRKKPAQAALFARPPVSDVPAIEPEFAIFAERLWSVFEKFPLCEDEEQRLVR